jgi:phosphatidylglycerol---prolipoprotein diacylglyceryl transferase
MLTLAHAWVHDLDPVIFSVGPLAVRWYGLSYMLGFVVAALLLRFLATRGATPIPRERAMDVILWLVAGVMIGGRLGYVLIYQPQLLWTFRPELPFWDLLALHRGGMASHGGIIGVAVAALRISRGWKSEGNARTQADSRVGTCPWLHVTDLIALIAAPGLMFGRLANFINGELLGKVVAGPGMQAPWWSVRFWQEVPERWDELPVHQQTMLAEYAGVPVDLVFAGEEAAVETVIDSVALLGFAAQDGVTGAAEQLSLMLNARHPSQLYQAVFEGLLVALVLWWLARKPRRPGLIGAWFLIIYGVGRVLTEFYRLPDTHLVSAHIAGLSRGQWLSVGMFVGGVSLLWAVTRGRLSDTAPMGGWSQRSPLPAARPADTN